MNIKNFKKPKKKKKPNEYRVSYAYVCKRSRTSSKLDVREYQELWFYVMNNTSHVTLMQKCGNIAFMEIIKEFKHPHKLLLIGSKGCHSEIIKFPIY